MTETQQWHPEDQHQVEHIFDLLDLSNQQRTQGPLWDAGVLITQPTLSYTTQVSGSSKTVNDA